MLNKSKELNNMTKIKLPKDVKATIDSLSYDDLLVLFKHMVGFKYPDKDAKATALQYINKRLLKLQKEQDYKNKDMTDSEFVAKWGA